MSRLLKTNNYIILISIVSLIFFSTCKVKEDYGICGVQDPVNELVWLKRLIDTAELNERNYYDNSVIYLETYNSQSVFYFDIFYASCKVFDVYYCDVSKLEFNQETGLAFFNSLKRNKIIWEKQ